MSNRKQTQFEIEQQAIIDDLEAQLAAIHDPVVSLSDAFKMALSKYKCRYSTARFISALVIAYPKYVTHEALVYHCSASLTPESSADMKKLTAVYAYQARAVLKAALGSDAGKLIQSFRPHGYYLSELEPLDNIIANGKL